MKLVGNCRRWAGGICCSAHASSRHWVPLKSQTPGKVNFSHPGFRRDGEIGLKSRETVFSRLLRVKVNEIWLKENNRIIQTASLHGFKSGLMGKKNSKLKSDTITRLTTDTYCKINISFLNTTFLYPSSKNNELFLFSSDAIHSHWKGNKAMVRE